MCEGGFRKGGIKKVREEGKGGLRMRMGVGEQSAKEKGMIDEEQCKENKNPNLNVKLRKIKEKNLIRINETQHIHLQSLQKKKISTPAPSIPLSPHCPLTHSLTHALIHFYSLTRKRHLRQHQQIPTQTKITLTFHHPLPRCRRRCRYILIQERVGARHVLAHLAQTRRELER